MKVLIVASVPSFIGQFNMDNIRILQSLGYKVEVAFNCKENGTFTDENTEQLYKQLKNLDVKIHNINFTRSPYSKKIIQAYKELKLLIENNQYKIIHCHTPVASILSRLTAKEQRKKGSKVIYTAHGFHFYKGAPLLNWMLFYPIELFCSKHTDVLITMNKEDNQRAKRRMFAKINEYIPGVGIPTQEYKQLPQNYSDLRSELNIPQDAKLIFSMGELSIRKNHESIIRAIGTLKDKNIHYVIAGIGDLEEELRNLAKELNVNLHLIGYRTDKKEIFAQSNLFCFPSLQEGLPVSLMEAIAAGVPCVVSEIRGNVDLIQHDINGYTIKSQDINSYAKYIKSSLYEEGKTNEMIANGLEIIKEYDVHKVENIMKKIYKF